MFEQAFANLAIGFSSQFGAPFHDATANWRGEPVKDDGGSITEPGTPVSRTCKAQISAPTTDMRAEEGFRETDMRLYVLAVSLAGALDTDATVVIATGPHAGSWKVESATKDTAGIGWACRGRKVS